MRGEVQCEGDTRLRQVREFLTRRHVRRQRRHAGDEKTLTDPGHGEFGVEGSCGRGERGYAGHDLDADPQASELAVLLGERRIQRNIAGMQTCDVGTGRVCLDDVPDDLVERHPGRVDQGGAGRTEFEEFLRDK
ncbi:Uncharacterised protein [Mycobacteroides abscessus subsp. abscessus]|nr:Uncharacterised protein [Mycobacteroides abscessus subsp. abscessus]